MQDDSRGDSRRITLYHVTMTYTLRLHGIAIGRSDLDRLDPAAGFARGTFSPATGYQLVQDVFRLYADAVPETPGAVANPEKLQRYYKARDALQLELIDPDGRIVSGTTVHVYERGGRDDALELEVHIADSAFWRATTGRREET